MLTSGEKNHDLWYSEYHIGDDIKLSLKVEEVLHTEQTPFQKIMIMRNNIAGVWMTLDGYVQLTEADEFIYHDMIVHPAMAVNPQIQKVLIIGGGDGGTAREVCRYPSVQKIDMIEIDERVVRACQKYLPAVSCALDHDPRLTLLFADGLSFVRDAKEASYDLILVDSTDPDGPGEGLFTVDFYRNCFRVLTEKGILINQHESAFYRDDARELRKAHAKIREVFPVATIYGLNMPTYSSGYWYFGFASKGLDPVADHNPQAWEENKLKTKYYNSQLHKSAFALPTYVRTCLASSS